jgi:membrane protein implicated in regulation of membrane protease activity
MSSVFLYCAAIGGTLLCLQFLLLLFGAGGDHDTSGSHDGSAGHDQSAFLKLFSVQTISTFGTFFGLVGLATESLHWSPIAVAGAASLAGITSLWFVGRLMRGLAALQSQGNVDLQNAVGHTASVYLKIPANGLGHGRIMLQVQGRTVEAVAVSKDRELPTGASCRVIERKDDDTLVVEAAS